MCWDFPGILGFSICERKDRLKIWQESLIFPLGRRSWPLVPRNWGQPRTISALIPIRTQSKAWAGSDLLSTLKCVPGAADWNNHKNFVWQELPCLPEMSRTFQRFLLSKSKRASGWFCQQHPGWHYTTHLLEYKLSVYWRSALACSSRLISDHIPGICISMEDQRGQKNIHKFIAKFLGAKPISGLLESYCMEPGPQPSTHWQYFSSQ